MDFDIEKAVRDEVLAGILEGRDLEEKLEIRVKPGFRTGCWTWRPPHRIYIGSAIFENKNVRPDLTDEQRSRYIAAYVRHEQGHGMFTERDLKAAKAILETEHIPFGLWNLFEDARMEAHYRRRFEVRFGWSEFEDPSFDPEFVKDLPSLAQAMLFALIQSEGDASLAVLEAHAVKAGCGEVRDERDGSRHEASSVARSVLGYYTEMCAMGSALADITPLLRRWIEEFGQPPEQGGGGGSSDEERPTDLSLSLLLQTDPAAAEAFDQDVKELSPKEPPGGPNPEARIDLSEGGTADLLVGAGEEIDAGRVRLIVERLRRLFQERVRVEYSEEPAKRFSARHCAIERPPYRHRTVTGPARQRVELVIDCSGSMTGIHIEEARILGAALSELALEGRIEGHIILAVGDDRFHWQRFRLPMSIESLGRIAAFGAAEGLEYALRANIDVLRRADIVCVYTDGCITDTPIDKTWLHQRGVYTWGLYVGDDRYLLELEKYFDRSLIRDSLEALAGAMLTLKKS